MSTVPGKEMFGGYCYGPVDVIDICKGDTTMSLMLRDSSGREACATYEGCVYWRIGNEQKGEHFSLVKKVSADDIIRRDKSVTMLSLQKNNGCAEELLRDWEKAGLNFYIHIGKESQSDYLVVAETMTYNDNY